MHVKDSDIARLKEIQGIDAQIKDELAAAANFPELSEMKVVLAKKADLVSKTKQIEAMQRDISKRFEKLNIEDVSLSEREKSVQKSIDEAAGDYRNLEVHTKELDSVSSRRNTIAEMMLKITIEQDKADELSVKLDAANKQVDAKIEQLDAKIRQVKGDAEAKIKELAVSRASVHDKMDGELASVYDEAASKVGNVVLCGLDGDCCSVCKSHIEEGKLLEIKNNGNVAVCPSCNRIMILK